MVLLSFVARWRVRLWVQIPPGACNLLIIKKKSKVKLLPLEWFSVWTKYNFSCVALTIEVQLKQELYGFRGPLFRSLG
jgi:hypothetical protein